MKNVDPQSSAMSATSSDECTEFQAHQWKKDVCVNCARAQNLHKSHPQPSTRKPVPKTRPTAAPVQQNGNGTGSANLGRAHDAKMAFLADKPGPAGRRASGSAVPSTQVAKAKPTRQSSVSAAPSRQSPPGATKPSSSVITNCQSSVTKPQSQSNHKLNKNMSNEQGRSVQKRQSKQVESVVSKSQASTELTTARSISIDSATPTARQDAGLARSQSQKEEVATRRQDSAAKRQRKNRMSRPAGPPPEAPKSPDSTKSHSTESLDLPINLEKVPSELLEDIKKQLEKGDDGSHYYHKYDISASLRRKQPALVDIETRLATATPEHRNALIERIKESLGESALQDSLPNDITPDQIAMPYNIVDVSGNLPRDDRPPQLPATPNPSSQDSLDRASLARRAKLKKEQNGNDNKSQLPSHHPLISHTYEPINDPNGNSGKDIPFIDETSPRNSKDPFVRASPVRSTAPARGPLASSWKPNLPVDSKMSTIAHLDLSTTTSPSAVPSGSPNKQSPPEDSKSGGDCQTPPASRKASKTKEKPKKERSGSTSGGFFKKLFGFGRRDSAQDNESSGNGDPVEMVSPEPEPSSDSVEEESSEPMSTVASTAASTAASIDDLSSSHADPPSEETPPLSMSPLNMSPLNMSPLLSGDQVEKTTAKRKVIKHKVEISTSPSPTKSVKSETVQNEMEHSLGGKMNSFVSFQDEMEEMFKDNLTDGLNINFSSEPSSPPPTDQATLVGATSLTDEILDMLSNFGGDEKKPGDNSKPSPQPIPQTAPLSPKPSLPTTKPGLRPKPDKPVYKPSSPSTKPPSPPIGKPKPTERKKGPLGELTIEVDTPKASALKTHSSDLTRSAKSPQVSFDVDPNTSKSPQRVRESVSQSSLLSDGSSSSRGGEGDQQSSGESLPGQGGTQTRRPRPRSTAVSRKMLNAPPPPPPDGKRRSDGGPISPGPMSPKPGSGPTSPCKAGMPASPKFTSTKPQISPRVKDADGKTQSPRHLEISGPISVTTTLNTSQTLPRPIRKKTSPEDEFKTSADDLSQYRKKKRGDSAAKHARNKTVTEGISFDLDQLNGMSDEDRLNQLLENRSSKFVNRALPPPPTAGGADPSSVVPAVAGAGCKARHSTGEDSNYEFVSMTEGGIVERGNYEDIDSLYSAIPADKDIMSVSMGAAASGELDIGLGGRCASDDYLEPVCRPGEEVYKSTKPKSKSILDRWTPKAAKRLSDWAEKKMPATLTESYVMVYANTDVLLDKAKPALSIPEGFNKMSVMNIQTLQHIADNIFRKNCPVSPHFDEDLHFSDFSIGDSLPVLTQGCVCIYRACSAKVKPHDSFLMLSAKSLHRGFLDQQSCHLVSPSVLLSDRISAEYFPEPSDSSDPDHYQLYGMVQTNMAVLPYSTVTTLPVYVNELNQRINIRGTNSEEYERQVAYCLSQIFTAILDSYSTGPQSVYAIRTLGLKDVAVVTTGGRDEKFLLVNAASQNHKEDVDYHTLCTDIIRLLCFFLNMEYTDNIDSSRIPAKSRYSRGLRQFIGVLGDYTFESLIQGKNILEYLLWGPCLEDHRVLVGSADTAQAFTVWLEVARCKAVTDMAMGQLSESVHTANRFKFLCCVTGISLQETALLLKI